MISEGVPNILDVIRSGMIDLIIDIPKKGNDIHSERIQNQTYSY